MILLHFWTFNAENIGDVIYVRLVKGDFRKNLRMLKNVYNFN